MNITYATDIMDIKGIMRIIVIIVSLTGEGFGVRPN